MMRLRYILNVLRQISEGSKVDANKKNPSSDWCWKHWEDHTWQSQQTLFTTPLEQCSKPLWHCMKYCFVHFGSIISLLAYDAIRWHDWVVFGPAIFSRNNLRVVAWTYLKAYSSNIDLFHKEPKRDETSKNLLVQPPTIAIYHLDLPPTQYAIVTTPNPVCNRHHQNDALLIFRQPGIHSSVFLPENKSVRFSDSLRCSKLTFRPFQITFFVGIIP